MKLLTLLLVILLSCVAFGQANKDLQAVAETEKEFARFAGEKGTKAAFLEYAAPDGIMFVPTASNAKAYWNARGEWKGLLFWQPSFADISSNGMMGWTTGPWEHRPEGASGKATSWGEFVTVWQKQPDGKFRWVLDLGISHAEAPAVAGVEWKAPVVTPATTGKTVEVKASAGETANSFFQTSNRSQLLKAYKTHSAKDIRVLREGKMPILGKEAFLAELKKNKMNVSFNTKSTFFAAADLAYIYNTYALTRADKSTEHGNFVQIWKYRDGKWQIVLDIFNPIPEEKK